MFELIGTFQYLKKEKSLLRPKTSVHVGKIDTRLNNKLKQIFQTYHSFLSSTECN